MISFVQSNYGQPGAGTTNCNLVINCSISAISATPAACNPATNTFAINGNIEFSNPPTSGTLTITDMTAMPTVSQTFSAPFVSPQSYSLTGIPCDGGVHTLQAAFSDSATCVNTQTCQAPPAICPIAVISGGGTVCNNGSNTGTVDINISGGAAPYSFTYAIDAVPQTPVVNYSGSFPYVIIALGSGTYTLLSVSDNACSGTVSGSAIVSFVPLPTVTFASLNPVCITSSPFPLTGGFPIGGTYSGAGVTAGLFNPSTAGAGLHTITYTYTDNNNCTNSAQSVIIVNPIPVVTVIPGNTQICSGTQTNISFQSNIAGSTFSWTASASSPNITGYSNGTDTVINQILINSGNTIDSVTYVETPHANGCDGNPVAFSIKVFPVPGVIANPSAPVICSGQTTYIQLTSVISGTTFTWTANGSSGNISGYSYGSGSSIIQTLTISGYTIETVTYTITPHISNCTGIVKQVVVMVHPVMAVTFGVCVDTITIVTAQPYVLKGGIPLGGTYTGNGVNPATGVFYPALAGIGSHFITYTYSNQYSCSNSASRTIHIISDPVFNCGDTLNDIRDQKQYPTIQIGGQCWQAANLNFGSFIVSSQYQRDNCIAEKFCYNDNLAACATEGGLYQWDEMMQYQDVEGIQGLCPPGWHLPSEQDWNTLFSNYTNNGFAALPLLYTGYSGFHAFTDGVNYFNNSWQFNSFATYFWSSTPHGTNKAWAHAMNTFDPSVSYYPSFRSNAFPVRCLKN